MKVLLVLLLMPLGTQAAGVALEAGVGKAEITPASYGPMYGYANRKCGPAATGVHDPLYAKALVLRTGETALAIVTLDLGSMANTELRARVAAELKIPVLLLAASHTHSGPQFLPPGDAPPTPYLREVEARIFDAVKQAASSMFPARLSIARGEMQLGYNRLLRRDDGRARALFDNLERIPYGPTDPEFTLLGVEDESGGTRALVVHYAAHSVVLGPTNCKYSADYPGVLQARVESELPGTECMFVQGGAGDINPLFQGRTGNEEADFLTTKKMGDALAREVLAAWKPARKIPALDQPIRYRSETLEFGERWSKDKRIAVGISTVLVGRDIAIAATPGEVFHKLQKMWKSQADVQYPLFYGYTFSSGGVWPGYIPDLRSAAYGGYGADVTTRIEVGAGERIIQRHLVHLYDMLGMWREAPGKP